MQALMRCQSCGKAFRTGLGECPECGWSVPRPPEGWGWKFAVCLAGALITVAGMSAAGKGDYFAAAAFGWGIAASLFINGPANMKRQDHQWIRRGLPMLVILLPALLAMALG